MTKAEPLQEWDFAGAENPGFHPAADIFPAMSEDEFEAFKQDVNENGLQTPIVTIPDGRIIDGRHRWRACMATKTQPRYIVYRGNPWNYVISANLHRRHLNASQRAMVVARIANTVPGWNGSSLPRKRGEDVPHLPPTQGQAAEMLNVGRSSVTDARRVVKRGLPELQATVDEGLVRVGTAARLSGMDEDTQRAFIARVRSGERPTEAAPIEGTDYTHGRSKRVLKHPSVTIFTKLNAENLSSGLFGIEHAFQDVTSVDEAVTPEMARQLGAQIKQTKTVLNRLGKLLQALEPEG